MHHQPAKHRKRALPADWARRRTPVAPLLKVERNLSRDALVSLLVCGGKHRKVLEVFRDVERQVLGREAADVRDDAVRRAQEQKTRQLSLLRAPPATDIPYQRLHQHDVDLARADVKTWLRGHPGAQFQDLWPHVLEERHLTVGDVAQLVWQLHKAGVVRIENLGKKRSVKPEHRLMLQE